MIDAAVVKLQGMAGFYGDDSTRQVQRVSLRNSDGSRIPLMSKANGIFLNVSAIIFVCQQKFIPSNKSSFTIYYSDID